jgi:site-specific DNA recombinase
VRAAVYARISKDRAGLSENVSVQVRETSRHAEAEGWPLVATFTDNDLSASRYSTKPRPGYLALMDAVRRGEVDAILVTEMSRLYRRLDELLELIRLAETTQLSRIETTDGAAYYLNTAEGIHAAVSAVNNSILESRKLSDRLKRKKKARAAEGGYSGGSRPYGYEKDGMTIREDEAEIYREVVRRVIAGESVTGITRDLNERGVTTGYGKQWRVENLKRLLEKKRYIGIREHGGMEYPAQWPGIMTAEEYELIQAAYRSRKRGPRPSGLRSYLLTGLIYCSRCDNPMIGSAKRVEGVSIRRYRCRHHDNTGRVIGCGTIFRMAEPLEDFVSEAILYRLDTSELKLDVEVPEIGPLMKQYDMQRRKLDELVEDYASGLLDRKQFAQAKTVVERQMAVTRGELSKVQQNQALQTPPGQTLREAWETAGLDWKRQLVSLLIKRIDVLPGHPGSHLYKGWRFDPNLLQIEWLV